jgi:hypothetical protein
MTKALVRTWIALVVVLAATGGYLRLNQGPAYPAKWDPRVLDVVHFVEQNRGLTFKHPVAVRFLDDKAFVTKVQDPAPTKEDRKDEQRLIEELRALGMLSGAPDLFKASNDLTAAGVLGVYIFQDKTLYVRGRELTAFVRVTLAHELTHALQDQYFDLGALRKHAPGGDDSAVTALIEGDAMRIESAYENTLSKADKRAYDADQSDAAKRVRGTDVPAVLEHLQEFPYVFGPAFLDSLVAHDDVDSAFRHPPAVDAQIIDPRTYPLDWHPTSVKAPALPARATSLDHASPFGLWSLADMLGTRLGYARAWSAAGGWSGDSWQPYSLAGKTCVAVDVAALDDQGAQHLDTALTLWAGRTPGATVTRAARLLSIRACDPGKHGVKAPVEPSTFDVLAGRAGLIHSLMSEDGLGFMKSACVGDDVIRQLGAAAFAQLDAVETPTPAQQRHVEAAFEAAAGRC